MQTFGGTRTLVGIWWITLVVGAVLCRVTLTEPGMIAESGCAATPVRFRQNTDGRRPEQLRPRTMAELRELTDSLFGRPDVLRIPSLHSTVDNANRNTADDDLFGSDPGAGSETYLRWCAGCHGVTGDGAGPLAAVQSPYPRDFRRGIVKFTSTDVGLKPLRGDLLRTLSNGIPGTAMPSFHSLSEPDRERLIDHIIRITVRGETEASLMQRVFDAGFSVPDRAEAITELVEPIVDEWRFAANAGPIAVNTATPDGSLAEVASAERGRRVYLEARSQCAACHGENGNGDGPERERVWDDWTIPKRAHNSERQAELDSLFPLSARRLRPRDFRLGEYRGGNHDDDIFRRIAVGVKGTPMPAMHATDGVPAVLTDAEIRDIIAWLHTF